MVQGHLLRYGASASQVSPRKESEYRASRSPEIDSPVGVELNILGRDYGFFQDVRDIRAPHDGSPFNGKFLDRVPLVVVDNRRNFIFEIFESFDLGKSETSLVNQYETYQYAQKGGDNSTQQEIDKFQVIYDKGPHVAHLGFSIAQFFVGFKPYLFDKITGISYK
jgi:hypothetical protein